MHVTFPVFWQVIVKILGDLANGRSLKDYSSKYLLIPSLKHWKEDKEAPVQFTVRMISTERDFIIICTHRTVQVIG